MNIPKEVLRKLYDNEHSTGFDPEYTEDDGHVAGLNAVAKWARKETLREAAEVALSTPLTLDDIGYEAQVIAEAILELAEGSPDGQQ